MIRPWPLITAHSGCMGSAPNSLEHIRLARAAGADAIELDIRLSGDGRVVLSHDDCLSTASGPGTRLHRLSWSELRATSLRENGEELRDLDAAFDLIEGTDSVVNLDAKEPEAAIAAAAVARRRGMEDYILFSGLGPSEVRLMRERIPRFRYLLNADSILPAGGYGAEEVRSAIGLVAEGACCGLNLEWISATEELMTYARRRCVPVHLWTVDDPGEMRKALDLQPYSLTTNRPDILASAIFDRQKGVSG